MSSNRLCLVTGGTGFVGRAVARRLASDGRRVRVLALAGDPLAGELRDSGAEVVAGDITDYDSVARAAEGAELVVHAAALVSASAPRAAFDRVNVVGTDNVCRACLDAGVSRLVVVSTADVFGLPRRGEIFTEASPFSPWGEPYPDTKIEAARVVLGHHAARGLAATLIYPGWVYGPGDRAMLPAVIDMVRGGHAFTWGDSDAFEVNFVYVDDLAEAVVSAAGADAAVGEGFMVMDDASACTPASFYRRVADRLGLRVRVRHLPYPLVYAAAWSMQRLAATGVLRDVPLRTNDVKSFAFAFRFDASKARDVLGWTPSTPLDEGLRRAVDWQLAHDAGAP